MVLAASFMSPGIMFVGIRFLFLFLKFNLKTSPPKVKNETFFVSTSALGKCRLSTWGRPSQVSKAIRGAAFFQKLYCDVSLWKAGARHSQLGVHDAIHHSQVV